MPPFAVATLADLKNLTGREFGPTEWMNVPQQQIQQFADATKDWQWIHLDAERAQKESPYHSTIAHGFLTLSLLPAMSHEAFEIRSGMLRSVNYGLNRVRFPSPVRSNARIRGRFTLQSVKDVSDALEVVLLATVEVENNEKPCCVAEWIMRFYPA